MHRKFEEISEATLWDDLKEKADLILSRIENIEYTQHRLNVFEKPRFSLLQNLLTVIGKDFFRIFLFKAIEQDKKKGLSIRDTVKNFQFFFWPGYTSLKGQRVFIEGALRQYNKNDRFFSGIGNNPLRYHSEETIINCFIGKTPQYLRANSQTPFWIHNIPSTLAFDKVMNQFYINKDLSGVSKKFVPGSMHYWKSLQTKVTAEGKIEPIKMRLTKDNSVLRMIEVSSDDFIATPKIYNGDGCIKIIIPSRELNTSGEIISRFLHPSKIPVVLNSDEKKQLNRWPGIKPENDIDLQQKALFELQKQAYSFWISETLSSGKYQEVNYQAIRDQFNIKNLEKIANRIYPYARNVKNEISKNEFVEIYYNNWYTLFLDSYSESLDLGTAMFLTNHSYNSDFLFNCSNWIRWIYSELRMIEAKALKELEGEKTGIAEGIRIQIENDFGKIAHNTKLLFPFLRDRIANLNPENFTILTSTVIDELNDLENIFRASYYLNDLAEFEKHYDKEKICLKKATNKIVNQIEYDILHNEGKIINLPRNNEFRLSLSQAIKNRSLFNIVPKSSSDYCVIGHGGIIHVILKDIISNAAKWCTSQDTPGKPRPIVEIKITESKYWIKFECTNSELIHEDAVTIFETGHIPSKSTLTKCFGLMICNKYCESYNIEKKVATSLRNGKTKFVLKFPKWIN